MVINMILFMIVIVLALYIRSLVGCVNHLDRRRLALESDLANLESRLGDLEKLHDAPQKDEFPVAEPPAEKSPAPQSGQIPHEPVPLILDREVSKELVSEIRGIRSNLDRIEDMADELLDHRLLKSMIPGLNTLQAQLEYMEDLPHTSPAYHEALHILNQSFYGLLNSVGLEPITPNPGEVLNPVLHHVAQQPKTVSAHGNYTIRNVVRNGWRARDDGTVLQPAEVVIGSSEEPKNISERGGNGDGKESQEKCD